MDQNNSNPQNQQGYNPPQGYVPPNQQGYVPHMQNNSAPLSVGEFFVMILLLGIPIVNIIMLFVWGFGESNTNKKNYSRAVLIWMAIGIGLGILFAILSLVIGMSIFSSFTSY